MKKTTVSAASNITRIQAAAIAAPTAGLPSGSTINVLWVGNSLTNTAPDYGDYGIGPLPERIKPMLAEFGITLNYSVRIQGGAEFSDHARNTTTMAELGKTSYDMVNLQGYYEGFSSAAAYQTAVKPLYEAARAAGSEVLFEEMWAYKNDAGSPQYPASSLAVEAAAQNMPGSYAVQVGRVWGALKTSNPTLYNMLFYDSTHQNKNGEYLNALAYTRFFSGKSVLGVASVPAKVAEALTVAQRQSLKEAVDANVTLFYQKPQSSQPAAPTTTLGITGVTDGQVLNAGTKLNLSVHAQDSVLGDISNQVEWRDENNVLLFKGAAFVLSPTAGSHSVKASVTGSTKAAVSMTRQFTVLASVVPPVAQDKSASVVSYEEFRQVNLTASAKAMGSPLVWTTLQLDKSQFKGVAAVVSSADPSTVNLNYGNGYVGTDLVRWRVQDARGNWSNWASINITVTPAELRPRRVLNMTRPDGSALQQIDPLWSGAASNYVLVSGLLRASQPLNSPLAWIQVAETNDQTAEAVRALGGDVGGGSFQLALNTKASQLGYRFKATSQTIQVSRNTAPFTCKPLDSNAYAGNSLTMRARVQAGRVQVFVNGAASPLIDKMDDQPLTGGYPGLGFPSGVTLSRFAY